jgi:cephalosporin-C deacetylase
MKGFQMTGWSGMAVRHWGARDPKKTWERPATTFSHIDPKNLARWVECSVLRGVGLQDTAAPASTGFAAYNQLRGPKEYRVYPEAGHRTPPEHVVLKMKWTREQFAIGTNR